MSKYRYALSAWCALGVMTMATGAFAQGVFSVSSGVEPRAREHGQTELAGGITLTLETVPSTAGDGAGLGTLSIDYGASITNAVGDNAEENEIVVLGSGCFAQADDLGDSVIDGSTLTITIGGGDPRAGVTGCSNDGSDTIDVTGVRVAIAGSGFTGDIQANIGVSGDFRLVSGGNRVTVINAVVDELDDAGVTTVFMVGNGDVDHKLTLIRHTGETEDGTARPFVLRITENTVDSFEGAELVLEFSGIPAGASIALDAWVSDEDAAPNTDERINAAAVAAAAGETPPRAITEAGNDEVTVDTPVDADENEATIVLSLVDDEGEPHADAALGGMLDPARRDTVTVRGVITFDETKGAELPLGDLDIQVRVDVGPIGVAKPEGSATRAIPRFSSDMSAPVTVIDVKSSQTTLVVSYALFDGVYDTLFGLSNMNLDDGQSGTIMFKLHHDGDDPIEYTTSTGAPGLGLMGGQLEAGATYSVLLSDILGAVRMPIPFAGYVVITTDFTGADGIAYITNWDGFTATVPLKAEGDE